VPLIRINCPQNSFTAEQKAKLAPLLIDALMRQEVGRKGGHALRV